MAALGREVAAPTAAAPYLATWTAAVLDLTTATNGAVLVPRTLRDNDYLVICPGMAINAPQAIWQLTVVDPSFVLAGAAATDKGRVVAVIEAENVLNTGGVRQTELDNGTTNTLDIVVHKLIQFDIRGLGINDRPDLELFLTCVSVDVSVAYLLDWWGYKRRP